MPVSKGPDEFAIGMRAVDDSAHLLHCLNAVESLDRDGVLAEFSIQVSVFAFAQVRPSLDSVWSLSGPINASAVILLPPKIRMLPFWRIVAIGTRHSQNSKQSEQIGNSALNLFL